jgi:hypothetical protein
MDLLPAANGEDSYGLLLFLQDDFGGFLPQPPYSSGGSRGGFTFGLPAHRSRDRKDDNARLHLLSPTAVLAGIQPQITRQLLARRKTLHRPDREHKRECGHWPHALLCHPVYRRWTLLGLFDHHLV